MTKRMAIFASGRGSNAEALYDAIKAGKINAEIVVLVSDIPDAPVLEKAEKWNIPAIIADRKQFSSKEKFEDFILDQIKPYQPDLIALAGFMRLLSGRFISHYESRIINIHPALLPSFKGLHAQRQAVEAGVKVAGCTVHFVEADMDAGPIIAQTVVPVMEDDTEDTLAARILTVEHPTFVKAVALFCEDKLEINGRVVRGA
ncbi:phosphoribosylglycinamide formyltransferase [Megasphaera paucivorans]|uniref:Phosphoribosylglycinamide formyltransferase n=1 Tax=Megasphaera paucivorans TaxID=349095 RepID=A0A1G9UG44_9FIRM|nr:phosphoribosylglycinamide formyltransferase [Megasphaera paucivorans]SDM58734.1 phosphoribosylglycinamide formyltransferase-1 [Megasphaera paucivorans]